VSIIKEADPTLISKISITFSFSHVFWIDASSIGTITQGLKGICNLPEAWSSRLDGSPDSALYWIGSLKENYIMVFDNADVLSPAELEAYFPPGRGGNILITSRNSTMRNLTSHENSLEVTEMEEADAIELLLKASFLDTHSIELQVQASKIVKELFHLPLAIDQAGAYIASGATTIGDYLAKYSEHRKTLLLSSHFTGASKYSKTVYATWELSYKEIQIRAKSDDPHRANAANSAILLLELFPFFHYEGITEDIFLYAALQEDKKIYDLKLPLASSLLDRRLLPLNKLGTWDNFVFREGLRILQSLSLIKKSPSGCVYAMHPLVHTWGRYRLTLNERKKYCLMVYVILSCSLRSNAGEPYEFWRTLVTHVKANMQYIMSEGHQTTLPYFNDAHEKFWKLLREQGYAREAESLILQVVDARTRSLGTEHPDTIGAMANLAKNYHDLGKYFEAEKVEIQVVDARKSNFGEEHPDTINAQANLAETYRALGQYAEAEKLAIQVLDARNRILGVEHPHTILARGNLAATYGNLGKYKEAEKLAIQVLDARNRILGVEHPHTILARGNLAATYGNLGKYKEAEKLEVQVLDARNKILGVEHPDTILAMGNLASTYRNLGKYIEAEKLEIQVLDARNKILGVEHPDTIVAMGNLAVTYGHLGKYTEAEKLEIQVLDARNRILGSEHPDTINALENLAETYRALNKYAEAERLEIHVLDARNRIFGGEHPDTINAMESLAETYKALDKYAEAGKLEIQALDTRNRILGAEHPDTIKGMENLVTTYKAMRKYKEAEELRIKMLAIKNQAHPDPMGTAYNVIGAAQSIAPESKQLVFAAKHALQHLQQYKPEIKAAFSHSTILEMDYILLAGFNESVIHSGIGYLQEIHVLSRSKFPPDTALLLALGKIFSPFPGMIFTTMPPYCYKTPVFTGEGEVQGWDETLLSQTFTYTTLQKENAVQEMELMSAAANEGKASGSGSTGGDNDNKKEEENIPQKGGTGDDHMDDDKDFDNDSEGGDPHDPGSEGSSTAHLPRISFNIQAEIYPSIPPKLASEPLSDKPIKYFQVLQLQGSISVQVGFPFEI